MAGRLFGPLADYEGFLSWFSAVFVSGFLGLYASLGEDIPKSVRSSRWRPFTTSRTVTLGIAFGLMCGLGALMSAVVARGLVAGAALGLLAGLACTLLGVLVLAPSWDRTRPRADELSTPSDPVTSWRADRNFGLVYGLTVGGAFGVILGFPLAITGDYLAAISTVLAIELLLGFPGAFALTQTWPAALASAQATLAYGIPFRMMHFLEDARVRHVLRTVGPVYQFRHARLQDRLAGEEAHRDGFGGQPSTSSPPERG